MLRTGLTPISTVTQKLLTGYAVQFNQRHRRHGHLFQIRYKSILCQQDPYCRKGINDGQGPELLGGGLIRGLGGRVAAKAVRRGKDRIKGDERMLSGGDFVQEVLESCQQQLAQRDQYLARGYDFDWLVGQVAARLGLEPEIVTRRGRYPDTVQARSVLCYWTVRDLGISTKEYFPVWFPLTDYGRSGNARSRVWKYRLQKCLCDSHNHRHCQW